MALMDTADAFFGSADDGTVFVIVNPDLPHAVDVLRAHGFELHTQQGRTLYTQPPGTGPQQTQAAVAAAFTAMLQHTHNVVDLTSTATSTTAGQAPVPDVRLTYSEQAVTATTANQAAAEILSRYGFHLTATADGQSTYALPTDMAARERDTAVVHADSHLLVDGLTVTTSVGITTAQPPLPPTSRGHRFATTPTPPAAVTATPVRRRPR
ncbi:hypothetical protein SSP35_22_00700 [Streptomyces sp. NBRC 110611]|uniref:hypothetical protein n=1 Tax=Streptomyces sp. NBRC 110611 TaxID=1621259 RepID=UPI0008309183|nr:hypothetical protein [Streptomyces sp. NBRC 110611]GAU70766.1 hypothetical protein SSP35_22_00700 [Streptomyces sp. NBRC 110611]